jgi:predicted O-methyltransferase YrrM
MIRIFKELYRDSPQQNVRKLMERLGLAKPPKRPEPPQNKVLDKVLKSKVLPDLFAHAVRRLPEGPILFLGEGALHDALLAKVASTGRDWSSQAFSWNSNSLPETTRRVVLTLLPSTEVEWQCVARWRERLGTNLTLLFELVLPFTHISRLHEKEDFLVKSFDQLMEYLLGQRFFAGIEELAQAVPLAGKNVIEFGPFDGYQTAGLVHKGVGHLTCIEARPENAIKIESIARVFGWHQVEVRMDDFHNAHATTHGRYDVVVAHGVYYHSIAPFLFLENIRSLGNIVFVGGLCATDELPASPYVELHHEGKSYRTKQYREATNHTAGVNRYGYYFTAEDLIRFFTERGDQVQVLTEERIESYAGKYLRFVATRRGA